ncbi:MAG: hypothetical protein A4E73_02536 [Syntrophaceae bacterium PtaU1.Bin231]|nr:MAG: hypothetical protein A4E73_02536 [Syntrophaceae bacterium PtaU1.Bin231]
MTIFSFSIPVFRRPIGQRQRVCFLYFLMNRNFQIRFIKPNEFFFFVINRLQKRHDIFIPYSAFYFRPAGTLR